MVVAYCQNARRTCRLARRHSEKHELERRPFDNVSPVNNHGDLSTVLKELGSSEGIKNIATALVTAGALQGLSSSGLLPKNLASATNDAAPFRDQLQRQLIDGVASSLVRSAYRRSGRAGAGGGTGCHSHYQRNAGGMEEVWCFTVFPAMGEPAVPPFTRCEMR
ncbi:DUF637 domain-containing protein [Variovorax sp. MHTC-1]|uniref:DUF637 domain-containing protein n=1 Tax=Variovorax sp. MHTC-1 TaxID=2495593 RepID=UPI00163CF58F|nr:DUF637 domain-containing protein [Variovorax sp. MHTC-1]